MNLLQNAIVHNLPGQGAVWISTTAHPTRIELTVENTWKKLTPPLVEALEGPFQRGS